MDKLSNLALVQQMLDSAEKSIQSAKHLLRESLGGAVAPTVSRPILSTDATGAMTITGGTGVGKVIEGAFDGQNMIGPDGRQYPVPANYASKSKLIEGDVLKLTIADDGSFIYKQIGPIDRKKIIGVLAQDERGDYKVVAEGKPYKVLLASLTYFKAELGDEVVLEVPTEKPSVWAAVVNVIKKGEGGGSGLSSSLLDTDSASHPADDEMFDETPSAAPVMQPEDEEL
jgi:hypothetical protein